MNTDPSVPYQRPDLAAMAANPATDMETLRTLAAEYPGLRATIALNPNAYDGLVDWLEQTGDPQVVAAVVQRRTSGPVWDPALSSTVMGGTGLSGEDGRVSTEEATMVAQAPVASEGEDVSSRSDEGDQMETAVDSEAAGDPEQVVSTSVTADEVPMGERVSSLDTSNIGDLESETASVIDSSEIAGVETLVGVGAAGAFALSPSAGEAAGSADGMATGVGGVAVAPSFVPVRNVPGGPTAQTESQSRSSSGNGGNRKPWLALLVALAVIAVLLLSVMFFLVSREKSLQPESTTQLDPSAATSGSESSAAPSVSAAETEVASPSPSPSPSPSTEEVKFPAPGNAISAPTIASPSRNLVCQLGEDAVNCIAKEQDPSPLGATCGAKPLTLTANRETTALACDVPVYEAGAKVLEFGQSATYGHTACTSNYNGISCWNTVSGKSLAISRQGWQAGTTGAIAESEFAWAK